MSKGEAVNLLMKEWRASEQYRPFFTKVVNDYMGVATSVLRSDIDNLRKILNDLR